MPYTVTKYPQGTFCWADVASTDIEATKKFMMAVMGWTKQDLPTPQGVDYTMFYVGDKMVAGGSQMPASMKSTRSTWNNYVKVDSVDEMAAKAEKFGGKVVMPAMDVIEAGRMVGIQDPTGAYFLLWQPKNHIGAQLVNTIGAMSWNELLSKDVAKAKEFYGQVFGWTFAPMESQPTYTIIKNNGRMNGGIFEMTPDMGNVPTFWIPYFTVKSADETVQRAKDSGGKVEMEKTLAIGKIAMITDPAGATFMIIEYFQPAEEWVE